jgi:threonine/homoserine/homoserine lactone efflux protein
MDAFTLLIQGAALGLTAAASPGSFQAYLINQTLSGGWRRGAPVAFAPLFSDPLIITLVLLLLNRLPAGFLGYIGIAGGVFVFYLAWGMWCEWRGGPKPIDPGQSAAGGSLRKGILMNLLSPGPYTFWALVCGPILLEAAHNSILAGAAFLLGFYVVFIGGMLGIVALFHLARRFGPAVVRALTLISILILIGFGVLLIWQGIK